MKRAFHHFRQETGQSLVVLITVAVLNLITQIIFRRNLALGEFGTLNTTLGVIGLMTVPLLAVRQAFTWYLAQNQAPVQSERIDSLRAAVLPVTETFALAWGALCTVLLFMVLPLLDLPRISLNLFALLNIFLALGALVSGATCQKTNRLRLWMSLLIAAAAARVLLAAGFTGPEPWAESGLAVFLFAGFITLVPVLRQSETEPGARMKALRAVLDRDFLLYLGATFSVLLAIFLFSSADRIVAQSWFGAATNNNMGFVDWSAFDAYQAAGLIGRSLLWGTQPLLLLWFVQRSRVDHTQWTSLGWFWIYLGTLFAGSFFLILFRQPISELFCGKDFALTARMVPLFAVTMVPLGLLQALGMFVLASRRYQECFVLGGCSVGFTFLLYCTGRQPQLMTAYMFGGGLVALMAVLFVGVVRWGRKQP